MILHPFSALPAPKMSRLLLMSSVIRGLCDVAFLDFHVGPNSPKVPLIRFENSSSCRSSFEIRIFFILQQEGFVCQAGLGGVESLKGPEPQCLETPAGLHVCEKQACHCLCRRPPFHPVIFLEFPAKPRLEASR